MKLDLNDQRHLDAAEGWLGLGDWLEANEELERITPAMRAHPFVLRVRWDIYAKAKKWEMAAEVARGISVVLPDNSWGWIHWAYSLHELKRTKEAQGVLLPIADKFPDVCKRRLKSAAGVMCVTGRFKSAASSLTMKHVSQYGRLD